MSEFQVPSREHSPFGAFNRSHQTPIFPGRDWDEDGPFHRPSSPNMPKPAASPSSTSTNRHVERIIPIQIVGTPSPPQQNPQPQHPATAPVVQAQPAATTPIVLRGPKEVTGEETGDKKYSAQRHNTMENLQVKTPEADKQRAKSEPPLQCPSNGTGAGTPPEKTTTPAPPTQDPNPNGIGMTEFGGNSSKNKAQENGGGGCRNIPIFVEGRGSGAVAPPKKGQAPTQIPQKNRFQPDHTESSTTPPPPPKKVTKDTIQIIQEIVEGVLNLEKEVNALPPTPKTAKNYIYLDEMLTRNLIKLDTIETEGKEDIRLARRDCIKLIQKVINILEGKSSETAVVPFTGNNSGPAEPSISESSALVPVGQMNLALTPTASVTGPVAMEISPTSDTPSALSSAASNNAIDEPMVTAEKVTA